MRVRNAGRFAALSAALTVLIGCAGDNMADVSGTVTVDGAPAEKGSVTFVPADGKSPTAGCEIANGKYSARVPPGTAKVQIRVPKVVGKKKLYDTPDSPVQEVLAESLPSKYNDKTELTLDVKPGTNEKNWELKK
ncbi:MAG: hypothetical protein J0I06_28305 [Planctomycetes bacterium]|nr:hypothetical protein [Planctomycetota bacterium]